METAKTSISTGIEDSRALDCLAIESDSLLHSLEVSKARIGTSIFNSQDLRNAIPAHCFTPTYVKSFFYLFRDCLVSLTFLFIAYNYIPCLSNVWARVAAWSVYGYLQGQQITGIWVLGHDAGHGAFAPDVFTNHLIGWIVHSAFMTPYFSWRSTHRRHHIYANHLVKDQNYVPPGKEKYAELLGVNMHDVGDLIEDSPLVTLSRVVLQQLLGFPLYLLINITAGKGSVATSKAKNPPSKLPLGNSHFNPSSPLFRPDEFSAIVASDIGVGLTMAAIYYAAQRIGWAQVALLYIQPYLWLNHWIIAVTYLQHTHPDVPKYEPEAWTFLKGATATIDRDLGFAGKHFMHNVASFHVVHHLFSRIPHYYTEEATKAIAPLLGDSYREEKKRNFWACLWETHRKCQYVEPDDLSANPEDRAMVYKGGPSPSLKAHI